MDAASPAPIEISEARSIGSEDLRWALRQGWADYRARRGELLLLPLIYVLGGVFAGLLAFNASLFPFFYPLAAGFALVGPIAAAGFYELARRRDAGEPSQWNHFFDPFIGRTRWPMIGLSAVLAGLFLCWLWVAGTILDQTLATLGPVAQRDFLSSLFTTPEGLRLVLIGNAAGAVFALAALAISTVSVPMVVDKATRPVPAIATSLAVFHKNPGTMLRWGLTVAVILLLASIPLFVGLMVALPVLGYATWHLYTRAVVR